MPCANDPAPLELSRGTVRFHRLAKDIPPREGSRSRHPAHCPRFFTLHDLGMRKLPLTVVPDRLIDSAKKRTAAKCTTRLSWTVHASTSQRGMPGADAPVVVSLRSAACGASHKFQRKQCTSE